MKLSHLKLALVGLLSFKEFRLNITEEMKEYEAASHEKGKSMPVYLVDDIDLIIGTNELNTLCNAFLDEVLNELEVNYVADALLLSNRVRFESESVRDNIEYLTDWEINGHLTKGVVRNILKS